jgi:hypothetical protein
MGESLPAISLLFIPNTLDMKDIGNWEKLTERKISKTPIVATGWVDGLCTNEDYSDHGKDEESDILFPGILSLLHRLPRLHHGDLLLLQRDEIIQLIC